MKCRFNHTRKIEWPHTKAKNKVIKEVPVTGKHWHEKICPDCRAAGKTKADDKQLAANKEHL